MSKKPQSLVRAARSVVEAGYDETLAGMGIDALELSDLSSAVDSYDSAHVLVKIEGGIAEVYSDVPNADVVIVQVDYDIAQDSDDGPSYTVEMIAAVEAAIQRCGPVQVFVEALGSLRDIAEEHESMLRKGAEA